jgi:hypothetical protein
MDALGADTRISIDITGGPRDAAILLTLAAQIIKMAATGTSIGEILYTHYSVKTIYRQNNTFDLIDLVNAIDAFTEYGRADQLKEFFGRSPYIWESTRKLCDAMEAFSNALTLCQPKGIERKVIEVQRCLDEAAEELGRLKRVYMLCTEALEDIESGSLDQTLSDTLKEIEALSPTAQLTGIKPQRLGEKLEQVRKASMMNRSELLFLSLFPAIREKFVPATDDQTSLTLELIKWCASHQMVVQALCIYRECIGQCLLDKGYFIELEEASELSERQRSQEIADLPKNCAFKSGGLYLSKFTSDERRPHPYYAIDLTTEPKLRSSIIWFSYLHATRNTIVHVDGNRGSFAYFFALEFLGKRRDEALDVPTLSQDILKAIDAIEHPNAASDSQWRRARSAAYDDMERYKQQNATS